MSRHADSAHVQVERPDAGDAELADVLERVWISRWGRIPVVAAVVIARIRRGTP